MRVLGLMSGTSLDGVDAAIIDTDGEQVTQFGPTHLLPFTPDERDVLRRATEIAVSLGDVDLSAPPFAEAEAVVLDTHVRAIAAVLAQAGAGTIDLIGFHGQTMLHRPDRSLTVQLGDAAALARLTGTPVIGEMRQADLVAGGQGAPLVPAYHFALARRLGSDWPIAFLNIGGVANISWLDGDGRMIAFDTGPGNGLIDLMVQSRGLGRYDDGGQLALQGVVDDAILTRLMDNDYFRRAGPKSLDRYDFPVAAVASLSPPDAAATLVAFTVAAVAAGARFLPKMPRRWVICGGGSHNPALMAALRSTLGQCDAANDIGLRGDFIEAEAMAFLAARSVRGLPLTFPDTTGVPVPTRGGVQFSAVDRSAA